MRQDRDNKAVIYAQQTALVLSLQDQLDFAKGLQQVYWNSYQQAALIYADTCLGG